MKIFILLFILFLSFLQVTFLPLNLILLLVISLAVFLPADQSLLIAFALGLLVDLISGGPMGLTSLFFLIISLLVNLYRSRFHPDQLRFLLPFTFLSVILFNLFEGQVIEWGRIWLNLLLIIPLKVVILSFSEGSHKLK